MAKPLVSDALWRRIEPLFPSPPPRRTRFPGRKPLDHRKILTGIVFVLKTGINWEGLPAELGWGCGKSCKNYLRAWQEAGIWTRLHPILLEELQEADKIDWSRGSRTRRRHDAPAATSVVSQNADASYGRNIPCRPTPRPSP